MAAPNHRLRAPGDARRQPPVAGIPADVWAWLRESMSVRPHVVARVRARLAAGEAPTSDEIAGAILHGPSHGPVEGAA